jgi:exopolysaccharide production protein ExoZ
MRQSERIISLQILRFVAAMAIVYCHAIWMVRYAGVEPRGFAPAHLDDVLAAGVDVFFVLSGFVIAITGPLAARRPSGSAFFWRRWSRVAPVFYILTIPALAMTGWAFSGDKTIATLLFWPAAGRALVIPYNGNGWTLTFEMVFYSAVALVMVGGRLKRNLLWAATAGAFLVAMRFLSPWLGFRVLANPIFVEFGLGVCLAIWRRRLEAAPAPVGIALLFAGVAILTLEAIIGSGTAARSGPTMDGSGSFWRLICFGLPGAAIVAAAINLQGAVRGRVASIGGMLGDASYAIYLIHYSTMALLGQIIGGVGAAVSGPVFVIALALPLGLVVIFQALVERPLMKWLRSLRPPSVLWGQRQPVHGA